MAHAGVRRALAFVTSTFSSLQRLPPLSRRSVRSRARHAERTALRQAARAVQPSGLHRGHERPRQRGARELPAEQRDSALVLFTAHSLPLTMARGCDYEAQLAASCAARRRRARASALAARLPEQQRVVRPRAVARTRHPRRAAAKRSAEGIKSVVVAPIGFVCDHMEVIMDLDVDAAAVARELGLDDGARCDRRHASRLRRDGARADRRAADAGRAARARSARSARATTAAPPTAACRAGPGR